MLFRSKQSEAYVSTGGKRAKSVAIPGATDEVFNKLGYFERQTDDWGDAFVLRV